MIRDDKIKVKEAMGYMKGLYIWKVSLVVIFALMLLWGLSAEELYAATNCSTYGFASDGYNILNAISYKSANPGSSTDADSTNGGIDDSDNGTNTNDCDLMTSGAAAKLKIKDRGTQYNWLRIETGVATGKTLSIPFKIRIIGSDEKGDGTCRGKQMFSNFQSIDVYNYAADDDNVVTGTKLSFTPASIITSSGTTANGCNYEIIEMDITSLYNSSPLSTFNIRIVGEDGTVDNTEVAQIAEIYIQWAEVTDTTPPTPGTVTVSPDANSYTSSSPTITTQFTDNESDVTSCEYTTDGSTWNAGSLSGTSPTWTCTANPTGLSGSLTINMRATSSGGTGTATPINRTVDSTAPTDGTLTATPGNAQVSLSWTAASDGESGLASTNTYRVVYDTAGTPANCNAGTQIYQGTGTSYTHTGLTNGTTYYYRVCATDAVGNESVGATASATPQSCQATAPSDLQATNITSSQVDLQWTGGNCSVNSFYRVYRDGQQISSDSDPNLSCTAGTMTYSDTTVRPNTSYTYTVRAYDNVNACESGDSNQVNVITPAGPIYDILYCTDCHGQPPAEGSTRQRGTGQLGGGQVIGSHNVHVTQLGLACTECHVDNGTPADTYPQGLSHRDGVIDFVTIRGGSYSPDAGETDVDGSGQPLQDIEDGSGLGSCSNTGCHGASSPVWGTSTGNPTCYQCHGTQANGNNAPPVDTNGDTAATDPEVGAHQAHLQATDNYSSPIQCSECHTVPTNPMDAGHLYDGTNDTTLLQAELTFGNIADGGDDGQANASPSYDYNTGTCSNVYCHDETYFKNGWGSGTDPTWNDTNYLVGSSADCSKCHGYPPGGGHPADSNCNTCHSHVNGTNNGFIDVTLHVNGTVEGGGDCTSCHAQQQGSSRRDVSADFGLTSHHIATAWANIDQLSCQACHGDLPNERSHPGSATTDPITELKDADTGTYYTIDPSTNLSGFETFCLSCHDADGASRLGANATRPFTDSGDNTAPPNINLAWTNTYNHSANATCLDCHGNAGAGGGTLDPDYNAHGSTGQKILRGTTEYDTCVTNGCHGSGGAATTDMTVELSGTSGKHPIGSAVTPNSTILQADTAGDLFVNGWTKDSVAQCSDCHGMNQAGSINVGPRGPHGSAYQYMLRGVDTSITGATSGRAYGTPTNANATVNPPYTEQTFCINCHASDVYGVGTGDYVPTNNGLSGIAHYSTFRPDRCGNPDGSTVLGKAQVGSKQPIGCTNCHAGAGWNYGAHSSTGPLGKNNAGFMNGNAWDNSTPPGPACYTGSGGAGATWNTCNKGDHGGY
jgi:predicted CxxxxCH...CXXCH cytochrome family protein